MLTPGGADVVFNDEAASAKAGQATVPKLVPWWQVSTRPTPYLDLSLPASSSAAPKAKAARKDYVPIKRTTPAVFYKPYEKPKGTLIVMVSGKPGSCFEHLAALLVDEFDSLKIAVESVADESFHEGFFYCQLCLGNSYTRACRDCPQSLESYSFYKTCRRAASRLEESTRYWKHDTLPKGFGVVIIQGRHILHEEPLCEEAAVRIWLDQEDDACERQVLHDKRMWTPYPNEPEDEFIKRKALEGNASVLSEWEHSRLNESLLTKKANCVIRASQPTAKVVFQAMKYIRLVFADNYGYILPPSWEDGAISEGWGPATSNVVVNVIQGTFTRYDAQTGCSRRAGRGSSKD